VPPRHVEIKKEEAKTRVVIRTVNSWGNRVVEFPQRGFLSPYRRTGRGLVVLKRSSNYQYMTVCVFQLIKAGVWWECWGGKAPNCNLGMYTSYYYKVHIVELLHNLFIFSLSVDFLRMTGQTSSA
jgi:hypothetical protein